MKCLEKDRNRRYETANGLAADITRHLNNEPVTARPPSMTYRFRKMVYRNKLAFAATVTVALALLAGIAATSWQAIRASRAEQRAERGRKAAMKIVDKAFNEVSPALARIIGGARPREILARAAADAIDDLQQGAELDVESQVVLGQLHLQLALIHGWYLGNTTGDYDAALNAATNAISLLEAAAAASPSDDTLNKLHYAEQAAAMVYSGLLKPDVAIEHFQKSHHWAARLGQQTTNAGTRSRSELMKNFATGNIVEMHFRMGRVEEVLTNNYLPELTRMKELGVSDQATNIWDVWGLEGCYESLGLAYARLGRHQEALPPLREALRLIELINRRSPHSPQFSCALALVRAETGEVLLCLNEPEEGLQLLQDAAKLADDLAKRDPANAGFVQTQVDVARRSAAGCIAWAEDSTASPTERQSRLDRAEAYLNHAQSLLAGLKSQSLRRYLAADLDPVIEKLTKAKAILP
jgi:tetratricopeptide (TPR) repeat protein